MALESQMNINISVHLLSCVQLFATPWTAACQASLSITNSQSLLKLMSIQPSYSLSSPSPPAFNLSQHQGLLHCKRQELGICNFDSALVIGFIVFILRTGKSSEFNELNGFCFIASFEMLKHLQMSSFIKFYFNGCVLILANTS